MNIAVRLKFACKLKVLSSAVGFFLILTVGSKQDKQKQHVGTDDLSSESYEGILIEAEKLTHDLTLQFGVLSGDCKFETEYLDKAEKLTKEIIQAKDWEIDDLF